MWGGTSFRKKEKYNNYSLTKYVVVVWKGKVLFLNRIYVLKFPYENYKRERRKKKAMWLCAERVAVVSRVDKEPSPTTEQLHLIAWMFQRSCGPHEVECCPWSLWTQRTRVGEKNKVPPTDSELPLLPFPVPYCQLHFLIKILLTFLVFNLRIWQKERKE